MLQKIEDKKNSVASARSGKNSPTCIEEFWRLAMKRIRGFLLAKTAGFLHKN